MQRELTNQTRELDVHDLHTEALVGRSVAAAQSAAESARRRRRRRRRRTTAPATSAATTPATPAPQKDATPNPTTTPTPKDKDEKGTPILLKRDPNKSQCIVEGPGGTLLIEQVVASGGCTNFILNGDSVITISTSDGTRCWDVSDGNKKPIKLAPCDGADENQKFLFIAGEGRFTWNGNHHASARPKAGKQVYLWWGKHNEWSFPEPKKTPVPVRPAGDEPSTAAGPGLRTEYFDLNTEIRKIGFDEPIKGFSSALALFDEPRALELAKKKNVPFAKIYSEENWVKKEEAEDANIEFAMDPERLQNCKDVNRPVKSWLEMHNKCSNEKKCKSRKDDIGLRWTGQLKIDKEQEYSFHARCDDTCEMYLNDKLVVSSGWLASWSDPLLLPVGRYRVKVLFFQRGGGWGAILSWRHPGLDVPKDCAIPVPSTHFLKPVKYYGLGSICRFAADCESSVCKDGKCVARGEKGAACKANFECDADLCVKNTCRVRGQNNGSPCDVNVECSKGWCDQKTSTCKNPEGERLMNREGVCFGATKMQKGAELTFKSCNTPDASIYWTKTNPKGFVLSGAPGYVLTAAPHLCPVMGPNSG